MKEYIGDGVYAESDSHGGIILTTENGICTSNSIYFEPEVIAAFDRFRQRVEAERGD